MRFHEAQNDNLLPTYVTLVTSFLGCFGSVCILLTAYRAPIKAMSRRIIHIISIADLLQAFPIFMGACWHLEVHLHHGSDDNRPFSKIVGSFCKWQSFVITTGAMLSFLWTLGLAQHMFLLIKFGLRVAHKAYMALYLLSVVPFFVNIIAIYYDILGEDDKYSANNHNVNWCWISTNKTHPTTWLKGSCPAALWDGKGFEIFAYIGVTMYCTLTYVYLKQIKNNAEESGTETDTDPNIESTIRINKILTIPLVFIVIRIWGTISTLSCYCTNNQSICTSSVLQIMMNIGDPLQGFANWILYWLTIKENWRCCNCGLLGPEGVSLLRSRRDARRSAEPKTVWVTQDSSDCIY